MSHRAGSRLAPEATDVDSFPVGPIQDFAVHAARASLMAALGPRLKNYNLHPQLVILHLPGSDWLNPVLAAWRTFAKGGRAPLRLSPHSLPSGTAADWVSIHPESGGHLKTATAEYALAQGLQVLVLAFPGSSVAPEILAAADITVRLVHPSWGGLKAAAARVAERPVRWPSEPSAEVLAMLAPVHFRLAARSGQDAGQLLERAVKIAARALPQASQPTVRGFDRVPGLGPALSWGRNVVADLADYRAGVIGWGDVDRGVLLSGPPGTGKTTFGRALAEEAGLPLIATSHARWQGSRDGHLGTTLRAMQESFAEARAASPCVLFIDELDSFPNRDSVRHDHADYVRALVNGFLAELDGAVGREGVVLVGACNNPEVIDPAILRSGRFDRHLTVSLPDAAGLAEMLRTHLGKALSSTDLTSAARLAEGGTGADAERWAREARAVARRERRPMTLADLETAIAGAEGASRSAATVWRVAVHEAGHALAAEVLRPGTVEHVSIRHSRMSAGRISLHPCESTLTQAGIRKTLVCLLSARAAEEMLLGAPGGGAGMGQESDLSRATRLAALAIGSLGFDDDFGLGWQGLPPGGAEFSEWLIQRPRLGEQVNKLLAQSYEEARNLVSEHQASLIAVAEELFREQTVSGVDVSRLCAGTTAACGESVGIQG